jgi:hypothetical protein
LIKAADQGRHMFERWQCKVAAPDLETDLFAAC